MRSNGAEEQHELFVISRYANAKNMREAASTESTWNEFVHALHAPADQDFDAFYWIYRLTTSLFNAIIPCRSDDRRQKLNGLLVRCRPAVPLVGMTLVLLCGWSYFSVFKYTVVRQKWCAVSKENTDEISSTSCPWEVVHGTIVLFLVINIIGHYLLCTFRSPGVANNHESCIEDCDHKTERNNANRQTSETIYHPDPSPSFCNSCKMMRPARAHHCRICKVCILQYDHHCPWVNNCIGHNNYRSFVLLVFYIMAGCTYGVCMLGIDFYLMMKNRIEVFGWSIFGAEYGTGLLDLPFPWILWKDYVADGYIDRDIVLRAAFPLMFFVGLIMYWFLGYHIRIILSGFTTLEDMSRPQSGTLNPFDDGPQNNLKQVLGRSWIRLFIPMPDHPKDRLQIFQKEL